MKNVAVIGGGSWGTALALVLAPCHECVTLWVHNPQLADEMEAVRVNARYLPGCRLPRSIAVTHDGLEAIRSAELVVIAVPSHAVRAVVSQLQPGLRDGIPVVSATKGLEQTSLLRMSEVIESVLGLRPLAVLSGPSFAAEVARSQPTALVAASAFPSLAETVQMAFSGPLFRVYTSTDVTGVELGGAMKNVIAIGAGVCDGMGLGSNARAALVTRGLAEMSRLALAMGAEGQTLSGLAGLGDLVLTCTGSASRNYTVGLELARGRTLEEILGSVPGVAEGVPTARSMVELGRRHRVELPIATQMDAVLNLGKSPADAMRSLMGRSLRHEWY